MDKSDVPVPRAAYPLRAAVMFSIMPRRALACISEPSGYFAVFKLPIGLAVVVVPPDALHYTLISGLAQGVSAIIFHSTISTHIGVPSCAAKPREGVFIRFREMLNMGVQ